MYRQSVYRVLLLVVGTQGPSDRWGHVDGSSYGGSWRTSACLCSGGGGGRGWGCGLHCGRPHQSLHARLHSHLVVSVYTQWSSLAIHSVHVRCM